MSVQSGLPGKATYFAAGEAHFADAGCLWKSFWLADVLLISDRYIFQTQRHRTCCIGTPRGGRRQCTRMQAFRSRHVKRTLQPPMIYVQYEATSTGFQGQRSPVVESTRTAQSWLSSCQAPCHLLSLYFSSASRPSTAKNRSLQINKSGSRWEIATGCSRNTAFRRKMRKSSRPKSWGISIFIHLFLPNCLNREMACHILPLYVGPRKMSSVADCPTVQMNRKRMICCWELSCDLIL